jgi:tetratricopeptide (TPR) repeat protein
LLAALVGALAYAAGFRKGVRTEQLRHAGPSMPMEYHEGAGRAGRPGPAGASLDTEALAKKLAEIDDRDQLVDIANQHLDQAQLAARGEDEAGAERRFRISAAAYERALELGPQDPDVLTDLGIALRGLNDPAGAVARFSEAADADPSHPQSRFNLGLVLLVDLQSKAEAVKAWKEYLEVAPKTEPEREYVERELARLEAEG